ncbi:UDP-glucose--hexose-1-phosphate uridylyltransferase [Ligilactobacillus apodemi]|uniref:Galactose-1-phosphate uridylyltransferase n=1 Tax=Ligilactobacillus apodemi DSM 16634 = JCM 16172 TaxID=1423724 RepID=A0A0R1TS97_9LACO|nr:UDP-glucose--hexose-1-phosphate uridylyltransferase [Ligilactobacillus apodemi]KRL84263.1 galactose-1-phosphate uridylyltransferase [Ligilactobacillus apodemi DSM 16634 = JCM 16172]MCR1901308.1 UDP-glucose--hexose-1-phosphate uridylyltransferase [Ligilactobacillus apodemi]
MQKDVVSSFVAEVILQGDYTQMDQPYLYNRVLALVGEENLVQEVAESDLITLKDKLVEIALKNGKVGETLNEQDNLGAELMNFIMPLPSVLNQKFWQTYQTDKQKAIADFYQLSQKNDYIKTKAIAKNMAYSVPTEYGEIEITINLSKPEKDPKAIAAAKKMKQTGYPKCQLCIENEGYQGRIDYPARANHRIIRFDLAGKTWGFQYSPYAYFNEHCIFLDEKHEPMVINEQTFAQLLAIVAQFPGYFAGSNADLPIVGGSILTHEHYQGGNHAFAMQKAPIEKELTFAGFEDVTAGIVKWPMSVIRLRAKDSQRVVKLAGKILDKWRVYSDESVSVRAKTNDELHHTITPIARKQGEMFELDLVLRDNQTSAQYPDGIFHPHQDVQHIKKENIGLIEVMGLAILPPRLKDELKEVEKYLLAQPNQVAAYHQKWAAELKEKYPDINEQNVAQIVQTEVGKVFARVLEDAGVFKRDDVGQAAFYKFAEFVGLA